MTLEQFDESIRRVHDFPKPGISFYDITSILSKPQAFAFCIAEMQRWVDELKADSILAVEARGFLFAAPLAEKLGLPLILARKPGKLPGDTWRRSYSLEYGSDEICVHKEDLKPGSKVLLVDDLIATGGTLEAVAHIIQHDADAFVAGYAAVIGLPFLGYGKRLSSSPVKTIINYEGE